MDPKHSNSLGRPTFDFIRFTEKGVLHYLSFAEAGINSKKCFIAMSFSQKDKWIYNEAIFPALSELGYEALKVDEDKTLKYRKDESTINDFILVSIKESKFCIADFTSNKNGVYFEAGYALARGKKVIYTCHEEDFKNVHFDLDRFPIIRYKTSEELKEKLINRIKETIS